MNDVSTRTINDFLRFLQRQGHSLAEFWDPQRFTHRPAVEVDATYLFKPGKWISWDAYATILEELAPYFRHDDDLREFMKWSLETEASWTVLFRPMAKLFCTPKSIYRIVEWATRLHFSNLDTKMQFHSKNNFTYVIKLRPEDRPSPLFYRIAAAAMAYLPLLAGYKPSQIQLEDHGHFAKIWITPPSQPNYLSFFHRTTFPFRMLINAPKLVAKLQDREVEIQAQHEDLLQSRTELQQKLADHVALLAKANARLAFILKNSPDIIVTIDRQKTITFINKTIGNFAGDQVVGINCLDYIPATYRQEYSTFLDLALAGKPGSMDLPITDNSCYMARAIPIEIDDNDVSRVMVISTDITQSKMAEQRLKEAREIAMAASRAKSAFLANVSHEIRTPLASIIGFAELIADGKPADPKTTTEYCGRILDNSKNLLSLVTDILDISKIEAGGVILDREEFNVADLVFEVMNMFTIQTTKKSIRLLTVSPDHGHVDSPLLAPTTTLIGDVNRLRQILVNLVGNAVKFTSTGQISICTEIVPSPKNPKHASVSVTVKDTGCGIDMANAGFLFSPFEQADNSTTRKYGGSGLGLFLSRELARALGGDLNLSESELGKGSTFVLTAAFESAQTGAQPAATKTAETRISKQFTGKTILVVEDNPDLATLITTQLESAGYHPLVAGNGQEAIRLATTMKPVIVLMDLQLPVLDGYAAMTELRRLGIEIPIVALTANAHEADRSRCLASGFTDYWSKPLPRNVLLRGIEDTLEKHRQALN